MTKASPQMRSAYRLALDWCEKTEGAFSATRPDGSIDLSGVVKALAIQGGGDALRVLGLRDWCLNAGGDVLTDGTRADGTPWVVGIVDPQDRLALLTQYACDPTHPAVATSGVAERGEHVWRTGEAGAEAFVQVTVGAPDIVTADVLATAILAGGQPTLDLALATWDVEVIAATRAGALLSTPAFRA